MEVGSTPASPSLRALPLFDGLPGGLLDALEALAEERTAEPWQPLLRQQELVRDFVVLLSGTASTLVTFSGAGGELLVQTSSTPGRLFGWSAARPPYRATASVRADTTCRYLAIPVEDVRRRLEEHPAEAAAFYSRVAGALAERTRGVRHARHGASM